MASCKNCGFNSEWTTNLDHMEQAIDLESELAHVEVLLRQLVQKRVSLKREINARSAPILRLPAEITSEIFATYLAVDNWDEWVRHPESPLIFGMVCSWWRELARSTPRLWRSLELDLRKRIDPVLVDQWLAIRSYGQPLWIQASLYDNTPDSAIVEIMNVIAQHSERWSRVVFDLPFYCFEALACVEGRIPNLEYISINKEKWLDDYQNDFVHLNMFSIAPRLHSVRMQGYFLHAFTLPTDQLTNLSVESDDIDECIDLLRHSPHVVDCTFHAVLYSDEALSVAVATRLESLEVGVHRRNLTSIFNALTIPAARELKCFGSQHLNFPHASFIALISRSSCLLHTLSLDRFHISDQHLIKCLRAVPSLRKLVLADLNITNKLFRMLNPLCSSNSHLSNGLLPNLNTLEYSGDLSLNFHVVIDFLRSRWERSQSDGGLHQVTRLESVKFCLTKSRALDPYSSALLQYLIEDGMKITLSMSGRILDSMNEWK